VFKAEFNRPKLQASLKRYSKFFGDTTAQAVVRWGVQTCRDLAFETQVSGATKKKKGAKEGPTKWANGTQEGAMIKDAYNVLLIVEEPTMRFGQRGNKKRLKTPAQVNDWIEINRTRRRARTAKLPISGRKIVSEAIFKKAMMQRFKMAGMAKGGWLGAGMDLAKYQTGGFKISIGKNFMSWTQKHSHFGKATKPQEGWRPSSRITNAVNHTASPHVLQPARAKRAIDFALKKTVKWYSTALNEKNKNNMRQR
jgi:hypothetical protein